jgi:uncharacterized protein (DUF1810 family)
MDDPHDLARFVSAQESAIGDAERELAQGRKVSHWMWFVFPQIDGLGTSATTRRYAIHSLDEARDYLAHPVLGPRLRRCTELAMGHERLSAHDIFGSPDDLKLRSCLTLFREASEDDLFDRALGRFYDGPCRKTLELLGRGA